MTVRARARLANALASKKPPKRIIATSTCVGQLLVQVQTNSGIQRVMLQKDIEVDLCLYATAKEWRQSSSFLDAVRSGHLRVKVEN